MRSKALKEFTEATETLVNPEIRRWKKRCSASWRLTRATQRILTSDVKNAI